MPDASDSAPSGANPEPDRHRSATGTIASSGDPRVGAREGV